MTFSGNFIHSRLIEAVTNIIVHFWSLALLTR